MITQLIKFMAKHGITEIKVNREKTTGIYNIKLEDIFRSHTVSMTDRVFEDIPEEKLEHYLLEYLMRGR